MLHGQVGFGNILGCIEILLDILGFLLVERIVLCLEDSQLFSDVGKIGDELDAGRTCADHTDTLVSKLNLVLWPCRRPIHLALEGLEPGE